MLSIERFQWLFLSFSVLGYIPIYILGFAERNALLNVLACCLKLSLSLSVEEGFWDKLSF